MIISSIGYSATVIMNCLTTMLVNMSIGLGVLPFACRTAVITPVPTPVGGVNDLRPISVTPILSRLVERLIVVLSISSNDVINQYGFKPTGSTSAVLVDLTNRISIMLEDNRYVHCLYQFI